MPENFYPHFYNLFPPPETAEITLSEIEVFLQQKNYIYPLAQFGVIEISGEDAQTFLQGQLSNDITLLQNHEMQLSAFCNAKGRVMALLYLVKVENGFKIIVSNDVLPSVIQRLKMFVLMSKVEIMPNHTEYCFAISGKHIEKYLSDETNCCVDHLSKTYRFEDSHIFSINNQQYLVLAQQDEYIKYFDKLLSSSQFSQVNEQMSPLFFIHTGLAQINANNQGAFTPHMMGYQHFNIINYQKGCYTGQEVIARTHYLGKLKKSVVRISFETDQKIIEGDNFYSPDSSSLQGAGSLINLWKKSEQQYYALALVENSVIASQELYLNKALQYRINILSQVEKKSD